jgi:hypothetical protein
MAQRATCTARLNTSTGSLSIDAVMNGASKYLTNFSVTSLGPLSVIQSSSVATSSACYDWATFSGSVLTIPDIAVGTDFYTANLRLTNAVTNQYSLDLVSKNQRVVPDAGVRVTKASNPFATVDSSGVAYLGYEDRELGGARFQSSSDGLSFSTPTVLTYNNRSVDSRKTLMPDGVTWRLYQLDLNTKAMTSYSSTNGNTFTADTGTRYAPASGDNNSIGVYDSYVAADNSLIMIYVGDLFGKNNLRMARSTDNGLTFTFLKGNVLGDDDAGGGGNTFIDNKTILLADGRRRMITMRANEIHSFISSDGVNYTRENGVRLKTSDFAAAGVTIYSLNDPVMVRTKEGGYRVYVAASTSATTSEAPGNTNWVIVSALWAN